MGDDINQKENVKILGNLNSPPNESVETKLPRIQQKLYDKIFSRKNIITSIILIFLICFSLIFLISRPKQTIHLTQDNTTQNLVNSQPTTIPTQISAVRTQSYNQFNTLQGKGEIQYLKKDNYGVDIITVDLETKNKTVIPKVGWWISDKAVSLSGKFIAATIDDDLNNECVREIFNTQTNRSFSDSSKRACGGPGAWPLIHWGANDKYAVLTGPGENKLIYLSNLEQIAVLDGMPGSFNSNMSYYYFSPYYDGIAYEEYYPTTTFLKIDNGSAERVKEFPPSTKESNSFFCWTSNSEGYLLKTTFKDSTEEYLPAEDIKNQVYLYNLATDSLSHLCDGNECYEQKRTDCIDIQSKATDGFTEAKDLYKDGIIKVINNHGLYPRSEDYAFFNNDKDLIVFQAKTTDKNTTDEFSGQSIFVFDPKTQYLGLYNVDNGIQPRWID